MPGCIGQAYSSNNETSGCYYSVFEKESIQGEPPPQQRSVWSMKGYNGDTGTAINNVSINDIRVNSLFPNSFNQLEQDYLFLSNVLFWSPTNIDAHLGKRHKILN